MLILASASPRRRELLAQAGFAFEVRPAHLNEDVRANEDPMAYVTRLARQKAEAVFRQFSTQNPGAPGLASETWDSAPVAYRNPETRGTMGAPGLASETWDSTPVAYRNPETRGTMGAPGLDSETWDSTIPERQPDSPIVVLGADTTVTLDGEILGKPVDAEDAARMLRLLSGRTHRVITGVALVTAERTEVAAEVTAVRFLTLSDEEIAAYVATGEPMDKAGAYAIQGRAARWIPRVEGCYFNVVGLPIALVSTLLESLASPPTR